MQRIFLSYTYAPHPDHAACLSALELHIRRVIESLELRVVDGRHLGGELLANAIEKRIKDADALIAIATPQADDKGEIEYPQYVASEFEFARAAGKPTFRVQHRLLEKPRGLGSGSEYILYDETKLLEVVMKVLHTLAVWKSERGRPVLIRIQPDELAQRFDDTANDLCEYQLLLEDQATASPLKQTTLFPEPGAAFVRVPDFIDGAKVRIHLKVQGDRWRSEFVQPHMGGVALTRFGGQS